MSVSEQVLLQIVNRLEAVTKTLESLNVNSGNSQGIPMATTETIAVFRDYWNKVLKHLIDLRSQASETKIEDLEKLSDIACEAICALQDLIISSESHRKPINNDQQTCIKKVSSIIAKASELKKTNKDITFHVDAVVNGLNATFWVFSDTMCDSITQTYLEQIDFPGNKVLLLKQPPQTKWLNTYKSIIKEMNELVKKNYKLGLNWSTVGESDISKLLVKIGDTYRKNFKNEEKVQEVTKDKVNLLLNEISDTSNRTSLKQIPKKDDKKVEEKKKEEASQESKEKSKSSKDHQGRRKTLVKKGKQETYEDARKVYFYENLESEHRNLTENLENRTILHISNCSESTFKVSKKINAIKLTNCEGVKIICDSLVTQFEITNSVNTVVDVTGTINSFSIDKSRSVILYLSNLSAQAQHYISKSSEVFLRIKDEKDQDNYKEYPIPEQFVFNLVDDKLNCKVSDLYN